MSQMSLLSPLTNFYDYARIDFVKLRLPGGSSIGEPLILFDWRLPGFAFLLA